MKDSRLKILPDDRATKVHIHTPENGNDTPRQRRQQRQDNAKVLAREVGARLKERLVWHYLVDVRRFTAMIYRDEFGVDDRDARVVIQDRIDRMADEILAAGLILCGSPTVMPSGIAETLYATDENPSGGENTPAHTSVTLRWLENYDVHRDCLVIRVDVFAGRLK